MSATTTRRIPATVVINAIQYAVAEADGAILFTEDGAPIGHTTTMEFERRAGCWFFTCNKPTIADTIQKAARMVADAWGADHVGQMEAP